MVVYWPLSNAAFVVVLANFEWGALGDAFNVFDAVERASNDVFREHA